ncbi:hypothetical protein CTEN210_12684 [Chaetoceros tenuissimus]|uniref:G-protein coupled receptors family 1 profile domain-containing protein n=1 Tax=Chaetoceros tenuissimus TaxID=426638 RepID=A0AAD3HAQ8_9STRA|nr:hypothetical protein CTEN210_12684 [Chaetoceros tenuissimus]
MTYILDASDPNYFFYSSEAQTICVSSATVSAISSMLILYIILGSNAKLSSPYHQIMFFMSVWDVMSSIAIALSTVPMPKDVVYPFRGASFGNRNTCRAQGFFILAGRAMTILSNVVLNLYYLATIRYGMKAETVKTRLIPISLGFTTLLGLVFSVLPLSLDMINPRIYEPYCIAGPPAYPYDCTWNEKRECIAGDKYLHLQSIFGTSTGVFYISAFVLMILSLVLVILSVFKTEKAIATTNDDEEQVPGGSRKAAFENTRSTLYVALMYIMSFILTWIWAICAIVLSNAINAGGPQAWSFVDHSKLIFTPLQGLWNALIFLYQKVYFLQKRDTSLTWFQALKRLLTKPKDDQEVIFSSLEKVGEEIEERRRMEDIQRIVREEEEKEDVEREEMERQNELLFEDDMLMSYPSRETTSRASELLSFDATRDDSKFVVSTVGDDSTNSAGLSQSRSKSS